MNNKKIKILFVLIGLTFNVLGQAKKVKKSKTIKEDPLFLKNFSSRVFVLEPTLGFQSHTLSFKGADDSNDFEINGSNGITYGIKALSQFAWFFGGVEYSRTSFDTTDSGSTFISSNTTFQKRLLGLTFGVFANRKVRIGVTVYPYAKISMNGFSYSYSYTDPNTFLTVNVNTKEDVDFYGTGLKLYSSVKILKDLTVNLTYEYLSFQEEQARFIDSRDTSIFLDSSSINFTKFSAQTIYLFVSYPIEFNFLKNL